MSAEDLSPKLGPSFERGAVMRGCLENYERAPREVKSLQENMAVYQSFEMMGRSLIEPPTKENT